MGAFDVQCSSCMVPVSNARDALSLNSWAWRLAVRRASSARSRWRRQRSVAAGAGRLCQDICHQPILWRPPGARRSLVGPICLCPFVRVVEVAKICYCDLPCRTVLIPLKNFRPYRTKAPTAQIPTAAATLPTVFDGSRPWSMARAEASKCRPTTAIAEPSVPPTITFRPRSRDR
jgi:hypothetical protein